MLTPQPRNIQVSYYGWEQAAGTTFGGGGWDAATPLTNLAVPRPQLGVLSGGGASVTVTLPGMRNIGLVHLQNLNTAAGGTVSVTAGGYSSGTVSAWAADANGTYPQVEWDALGRPRFFVFPTPQLVDQVTVSINGGGAFTLGYVGVCEMWQSPINMSYDWGITPVDLANVQRVPFGSNYPIKYGRTRRISVGIDFLREPGVFLNVPDEIFSKPLALATIAGKSSPIVVVPYPDDTTGNIERTSIWGGLSEDPPFTNKFFGNWDLSFQIDQWI